MYFYDEVEPGPPTVKQEAKARNPDLISEIFQAYSFPHTNTSVLRQVYGEMKSKVNRYDREK